MEMTTDDFRRLIARYRGRATQPLMTYDELYALAYLSPAEALYFTKTDWRTIKQARLKVLRTPPPMGSSLLDDLWRILVLDPNGEAGSMPLHEYWRLRAVLGAERRLRRFLASRGQMIHEIQSFIESPGLPADVLLSGCAETICGRGHHSLGIKTLVNSVNQKLGGRACFIIPRRLAALSYGSC